MKITNKYNLPEAFVKAVTPSRKPSDDHISATRLIDSPQINQLTIKHWDEIEDDAANRLWALMGSAVHSVLEQNAPDNSLEEESMAFSVDGQIITLRPDLYHNKEVHDYKITSVWSFLHGLKPEWTAQLNVYAYAYRLVGLEVDRLKVNAILRDWSETERLRTTGYPEVPFLSLGVPLWTAEQQLEYIKSRLKEHATRTHCTDQERWKRESTWVIMKKRRKSAVRVFDTEEQALKYYGANLLGIKNMHSIEERPGAYVRCESYCTVSKFCPQWKMKSAE
jgi:hypothetical protein